MVWQEKVAVIAMLTTLTEGGRAKCAQYWPSPGKTETHGDLSVTAEDMTENGDFVERRFQLALRAEMITESRTIVQLHFTAWPDHGVPSSGSGLIAFLARMQELKLETTPPISLPHPVVVHCSAGIGRTGVHILLEVAVANLQLGRHIDLGAILTKLRQQRMGLVQTEAQFVFCHSTIADIIDREGPGFEIMPS